MSQPIPHPPLVQPPTQFRVVVYLEVSSGLEAICSRFLDILEQLPVPTIEEFKAQVLGRIADLQAASANEHTQVLAAIDALKSQIGTIVPDEVAGEVNSAFDAAISGVQDIFTPE